MQKAPITTHEYEVSCAGNKTHGDHNDIWKVEVVEVNDHLFTRIPFLLKVSFAQDVYERRPKLVKALTTRFLLRHVSSGCLLRSGTTTLPQWGFKQAEVVCQKIGDMKSANNMWNVELHWNDKRTCRV
jgi:dolichyl-phosphate-mannose-protein mannosyltransferase